MGDLVATGDIAVHYEQVCRGVQQGEWMGLPPTGKEIIFALAAFETLC
jgi:predicted ester cyclase